MFEESDSKIRNAGADQLKQIIESAGMPKGVQQKAENELEKLLSITKDDDRYEKGLAYIGYLADLPWNRSTENRPDFKKIINSLDEELQCSHKIKEQIIQYLTHKMVKPKILIVDDEKIALRSIERALSKEGYSVVSANNGVEAIEILKETEFDVVITDLIMGEVDGHAVIEETKSRYPDTKVIMVTGYATVDTAVEAIRMGAFHYIEKPLKLDDVRSVVKDALKTRLPDRKETVLCLTGNPETDKFSICKTIADVTGSKIAKITLSDIKEPSEISGKSRTVEGAAPGRAIVELRRAGVNDPVIMLEGLDMAGKNSEGDMSSAILEMIENGGNRNFIDRYLEVPFDLSNVIFIATVNSVEKIDGALREILEIVEC